MNHSQRLLQSARNNKSSYAPLLMMIAGISLIAAAVVMVLAQASEKNPTDQVVKIGQKPADFSMTDINGRKISLSDFQGKVVLLNIWATWCPPCRTEMPTLEAFYQENKDKGFVILAIDAGDAQSEVVAYAREFKLSFPVLLDPQIDWTRRAGIYDYPTSVLIGRDGMVKNIQIGLYKPDLMKADIMPYLSH